METLFTKENIDFNDVHALIDQKVEESLNLEFKAAPSLENSDKNKMEISKDVSSFANSDGGIIIYGINERNQKAESISFIDTNLIKVEWLENIIDSSIYRRIPGIKIQAISYNGDAKKSVILVKIPPSYDAPHMAKDRRYYRRFNFKSVPMEEYEVRNLFNKKHITSLKIVDPICMNQGGVNNSNKIKHISYLINLQIKNIGRTIEGNYKLEIKVPKQLLISNFSYNPIKTYKIREERDYWVFSIPNRSPIFQSEITSAGELLIHFNYSSFEVAEKKPLILNLYYSSGIDTKELNILKHLDYKGGRLDSLDFQQ